MDFFQAFLHKLYLCVLCIEPIRSVIATEAHAELFLSTGRLLEYCWKKSYGDSIASLNSSSCVQLQVMKEKGN